MSYRVVENVYKNRIEYQIEVGYIDCGNNQVWEPMRGHTYPDKNIAITICKHFNERGKNSKVLETKVVYP